MAHVAKRFLTVCFFCLPNWVLAEVYPLDSTPDLFIDHFRSPDCTLNGTVESMATDGAGSTSPKASPNDFEMRCASPVADIYFAGKQAAFHAHILRRSESSYFKTKAINSKSAGLLGDQLPPELARGGTSECMALVREFKSDSRNPEGDV